MHAIGARYPEIAAKLRAEYDKLAAEASAVQKAMTTNAEDHLATYRCVYHHTALSSIVLYFMVWLLILRIHMPSTHVQTNFAAVLRARDPAEAELTAVCRLLEPGHAPSRLLCQPALYHHLRVCTVTHAVVPEANNSLYLCILYCQFSGIRCLHSTYSRSRAPA